jgi:TolB protein
MMLPRFGRRRKTETTSQNLTTMPDQSSPVEELAGENVVEIKTGRRLWLWTLGIVLAVALFFVFILALGVIGFYDGLKDRAIANRRTAQEHYTLGLNHLEAGDYELAVAEFEVAMRHDSNLGDLRQRLLEAKEKARAQVTPTSETRQDAAALLYRQAVPPYESGNLAQAIGVLEELRSLDASYQRDNVETMLVTAHYQLGLNAVQGNQLDEAAGHFEAVLTLKPEDEDAQEQLNLLNLYSVALNQWERDWSAAIQALKGLYALAPEYKDVQARLHNAHVFRAQAYADEGDWCRAAEEYAAAVDIFPLEVDVDKRDDSTFRCQATAEAPIATLTPRATVRPTATTAVTPRATAAPTAPIASAGSGQVAYTRLDAARQRSDIYVVDLPTGKTEILREMASQPAFASGGSRLAFRNHDPDHLGLDLVAPGAIDIHELTVHAEDSTPAWSPDAKQIAFASNKHGDRKWRIYGISPGEVRGEGEEWVFGTMPTWAPDNSRVAYHGCDERGDNCGVWVMTTGGLRPAQLTTDPSDTAPSWSPDGSQVSFISSRAGNWDIYLVDVESGSETRLTDHAAADVAPAWSPDGKRLAFLSNRDGKWALYILDVKSGETQRIINTGDPYPEPVSERLAWVP